MRVKLRIGIKFGLNYLFRHIKNPTNKVKTEHIKNIILHFSKISNLTIPA